MSHQSQPKTAPLPEPAPGDPDRWSAYTLAALRYLVITPQIYLEKPAVLFYGSIPGFEGLAYQSSDGEHFLYHFLYTLEEWLEYRLANRLPIPFLPGLELPTLEDFEEYDSIRAYDQGHRLMAEGPPPRPAEEVFAELDQLFAKRGTGR